jgi:adenylate cyclase
MESIDPGAAVSMINVYLDEMISIAFRHGGTLDRIVGDAVVIMFSAPVVQVDHRARALACALEMNTFATAYAAGIQAKGVAFGKTRIGIHTGEVIVGNFGGSTMFDYRALGDPVNTAARLEGANKYLGTQMCVSANTISGCPGVLVRPVGRLILKGKSKPLEVMEPVVAQDAALRAPLDEYRSAFEAMCASGQQALPAFADLHLRFPQDPLVQLHTKRLQEGATDDLMVLIGK